METNASPNEKSAQQNVADFNRTLFFGTLDALEGAKVLVWEQVLMTPFNMVAGATALKQHKVVAMHDLNECGIVSPTEHTHVVYIISSTFTAIKKLIAHLSSIRSLQFNDDRSHHVLIVPEATLALRERLQQNREIASMITSVESLPIRVYPLYEDLFTLLMDNTPAKLLLNNDWTELHKCASALHQLELLSPSLPNIRCKGKWAAQIAEMIKKMRNDVNETSAVRGKWNITDIVIVDRWIDPLTPMLTQHTYAGLIDEIITFGPSGNLTANFFPKRDGSEGDIPTTRSLRDEIFTQLRDLHIRNVGKCIVQTVGEVRDEKKILKEYPSMESMAERKVFVRRVVEAEEKEFNTRIHTAIAEHLMGAVRDDRKMCKFLEVEMNIIRGVYGERVIPFVEELMYDAFQPSRVLRLIALQCLTYGGLKPTTYGTYLRLFVQTYGAYETALWIKLQLMGLIYEKQPRIKCNYAPFEFQLCTKRLGCFIESDGNDEKTVSSAYSGYTPILIRHIELGVSNEWKDWATASSPDPPCMDSNSTTLIFVVGGITLAEVACLRRIRFPAHVIVVSSCVTRGSQLIRSIRST
uniref:Vacuolar protein sorting-associated protein 33A n=1 Tax=Ascaris suum TaxID=6253 RepID=F1L1R6_ASCSU